MNLLKSLLRLFILTFAACAAVLTVLVWCAINVPPVLWVAALFVAVGVTASRLAAV